MPSRGGMRQSRPERLARCGPCSICGGAAAWRRSSATRASTRWKCCESLSWGRNFGDIAADAQVVEPARPLLLRSGTGREPLQHVALDAERLARELAQP